MRCKYYFNRQRQARSHLFTFDYSKKELNIFVSHNAFTKDFKALIDLVKNEKVNIIKIVSGVYNIGNAHEAFEALTHNDGTLAKLVIQFGD